MPQAWASFPLLDAKSISRCRQTNFPNLGVESIDPEKTNCAPAHTGTTFPAPESVVGRRLASADFHVTALAAAIRRIWPVEPDAAAFQPSADLGRMARLADGAE